MFHKAFAFACLAAAWSTGSAAADVVVNFNDLTLPPQSYNNGANLPGYFTSGGATFNNSYDSTYGSWSGWSYSNVSNTTTPGYGNQYAVYAPVTAQGSGQNTANYGVAYNFNTGDATIMLPAGTAPKSVAIANTTYAALSMLNGDSFENAFTPGQDFFLLTINGVNAQGQSTGSVPFYLANYLSTNPAQDYIVSNWTDVDLTSLGVGTTELTFTLTSSQNGPYGMNTPAFFALDNLDLASVPEPGPLVLLGLTGGSLLVVARLRRGWRSAV